MQKMDGRIIATSYFSINTLGFAVYEYFWFIISSKYNDVYHFNVCMYIVAIPQM